MKTRSVEIQLTTRPNRRRSCAMSTWSLTNLLYAHNAASIILRPSINHATITTLLCLAGEWSANCIVADVDVDFFSFNLYKIWQSSIFILFDLIIRSPKNRSITVQGIFQRMNEKKSSYNYIRLYTTYDEYSHQASG